MQLDSETDLATDGVPLPTVIKRRPVEKPPIGGVASPKPAPEFSVPPDTLVRMVGEAVQRGDRKTINDTYRLLPPHKAVELTRLATAYLREQADVSEDLVEPYLMVDDYLPPSDEPAAPGKASAVPAVDQDAAVQLRARISASALMKRQFPPEERLLGSLVTRTSRMFLVAPTGTGKTMLGLAIAGGIATGTGFLNWRSDREARVLYIDGEMALPMLQARVRDVARRIGQGEELSGLDAFSWQDADELEQLVGVWQPLNHEAGQQVVLRLCDMLKPEVVIFDNVQALIAGDMKDEVPWNETKPLVAALTKRNIGQVWIDHTGHNTGRQYGSSTKAWQFDTVGILAPLPPGECAPGETGFSLSFDAPYGKARGRSPETWAEYASQTIRLRDDVWTTSSEPAVRQGGEKLTPTEKIAFDLLRKAMDQHGVEATVFDDEMAGLVVAVQHWRSLVYRAMPDVEQHSRNAGFNRALKGLQAKKRIDTRDDFVWPLQQRT